MATGIKFEGPVVFDANQFPGAYDTLKGTKPPLFHGRMTAVTAGGHLVFGPTDVQFLGHLEETYAKAPHVFEKGASQETLRNWVREATGAFLDQKMLRRILEKAAHADWIDMLVTPGQLTKFYPKYWFPEGSKVLVSSPVADHYGRGKSFAGVTGTVVSCLIDPKAMGDHWQHYDPAPHAAVRLQLHGVGTAAQWYFLDTELTRLT